MNRPFIAVDHVRRGVHAAPRHAGDETITTQRDELLDPDEPAHGHVAFDVDVPCNLYLVGEDAMVSNGDIVRQMGPHLELVVVADPGHAAGDFGAGIDRKSVV